MHTTLFVTWNTSTQETELERRLEVWRQWAAVPFFKPAHVRTRPHAEVEREKILALIKRHPGTLERWFLDQNTDEHVMELQKIQHTTECFAENEAGLQCQLMRDHRCGHRRGKES